MPRGYGIAVIALGLVLSIGLGQAQEPGGGAEGQTQQQQAPSQSLPLPFPVEIVEDQATTETRERGEREAAKREEDDLLAQQGMNAATQAMNEATQRMAYDSHQMTIATWIGVGLLTVTLLLTLQANRAAVAAVYATETTARDQLRPWLLLESIDTYRVGGELYFRPVWRNYGQIPAICAAVSTDLRCVLRNQKIAEFRSESRMGNDICAPGTRRFGVPRAISGDKIGMFVMNEIDVIMFGRADYSFSLNPDERRFSASVFRCQYDGEQPNERGEKVPVVRTEFVGPQDRAT